MGVDISPHRIYRATHTATHWESRPTEGGAITMATTTKNDAPAAEETDKVTTTEEATQIADGAIEVMPSVDLEKAKSDLASLTATAQEALGNAGNEFVKAARAIGRIRDEKLVEAVYTGSDGKLTKTFADYCAEQFQVTRDMGDKYARAGLIYDRIVADLGPEAEKLALPTAETQLRPLGKLLKSDPKKKLFGKVWKTALVEAEKKGGFVNRPTTENVRSAITKSARSFAPTGSTRASSGTRREAQVHLSDNAPALDKAVAEILKSYSDVPVATLRSIMLDSIRLAAKHNAAASVVEQSLDALLNPKPETTEEEQAA